MGIGIAFALDALSYAVSAWTLAKVHTLESPVKAAAAPQAVLASVGQGLAHFWRDSELRTCFLYWSAVALFIMGPVHIAVPVLASSTPQLGHHGLGDEKRHAGATVRCQRRHAGDRGRAGRGAHAHARGGR
jgi:hypothetical protein